MLKVAAFYAVFTPLSTALEHWYTKGLGWNEYVATGANMLLNFVTEFLYQRFFVFGKSLDTNDRQSANKCPGIEKSASCAKQAIQRSPDRKAPYS